MVATPESAGLDQPQAVAERALPDQRSVLPQDEREGERLWAASHLDRHAAPSAVRRRRVSRPTDIRRRSACAPSGGRLAPWRPARRRSSSSRRSSRPSPVRGALAASSCGRWPTWRTVARFMAGATIVKQGVVGDSFYVVLTGQAKVTRTDASSNRAAPRRPFRRDLAARRRARVRRRSSRETDDDPRDHHRRRTSWRCSRKDPEITVCLLEGMARTVRGSDRSLAG